MSNPNKVTAVVGLIMKPCYAHLSIFNTTI